MLPLEWFPFCLVMVSAVLLGLSKTGIPGVAVFAVVLMAFAFRGDAKYSVGIILPILIFCDLFAVVWLRRHVEWRRLWRLFPFVVAGIVLAWWTMDRISDQTFRIGLGVLILVLLGLEWLRRRLS
ncbi:MAG: TSUP family transporter, partial [Planctomycetia bacterium]|nr:TSUP family transporter [Planctomycetia bacterium]